MTRRIAKFSGISVLLLVISWSMTGIANAQEGKGGVTPSPMIISDGNKPACQIATGVNACAYLNAGETKMKVLVFAGRSKYGAPKWRPCSRKLCGRFHNTKMGPDDFCFEINTSRRTRVVGGEITTRWYGDGEETIYVSDVMDGIGHPFRSIGIEYGSPSDLIRGYFALQVKRVKRPFG